MSSCQIILFPGQGSYSPIRWDRLLSTRPIFRATAVVAAEIARRAGYPQFAELFVDGPARSASELMHEYAPELQVAIVVGSYAAYAELQHEQRVTPGAVFVGHSLGELTALAAAGAFDFESLVQIVLSRTEAVKRHAQPGGMVAMLEDATRVRHLVAAANLPDELVVAVDNTKLQVVVSGSAAALDRLRALARGLDVKTVAVDSPFAFHSPLMIGAVEPWRRDIEAIPFRPLRAAVYSPIEQRFYNDADDYPSLLATHLTRPLPFADAIARLANGLTTFIECGVSGRLTNIVSDLAPSTSIDAVYANGISASRSAMNESVSPSNWRAASNDHTPLLIGEELSRDTIGENDVGEGSMEESIPSVALDRVSANAPTGDVSREFVFDRLLNLYSEALEYPADVFGEAVDLEADLGVDSVKQSELMARAGEAFGLAEPTEDFRLADYATFGAVVDYVYQDIAHKNAASKSAP